MVSVVENVRSFDDSSSDRCDALVVGLASFPGWNESNFQVMDKMFETLEIMSARFRALSTDTRLQRLIFSVKS